MVELARFLIQRGATIDILNDRQETPLNRAAGGGHLDVVKLLLRGGADIEARNKSKQNAEKIAFENNKSEVAKFLAEYKSHPHVRNKIFSATLDPAQIQIVAEEEGKSEAKKTLHTVVEEGEIVLVRSFLDKGEDVNSENRYNKTPLDVAVTKGNLEVVRLLLQRGARVDSRDNFGSTPLHKAARYGHLRVSRELINHGANVNARKQDHWTPIHLSARNGHLGLVKLLLEREADVHLLNDEGRSPYQLSIGRGYREIANLLRDYERGEDNT